MLPILGLLAPLLGKVIGGVTNIVDQKVEDVDLKNQLKSALTQSILNQNHDEFKTQIEEQSKIIQAEANSQSWIASNWRPMIMILFGAIIFNNYMVFPYMNMFMPEKAVLLPVPAQLWDLLKLGLGGYVVSRSAEKIVKVWKDKK